MKLNLSPLNLTRGSQPSVPSPSLTTLPKGEKIGIAIGSGGIDKGWAEIGALLALDEMGIHPNIIVGCSIGAVTGGYKALGKLDKLETWARNLDWNEARKYLDIGLGKGILSGNKLTTGIRKHLGTSSIEDIQNDQGIKFAAVATDLYTGKEVLLQSGDLVDSMRASFSLPGVFSPMQRDHRWLVDGGLVCPLPVSICRFLGADVVIAINLNSDVVNSISPCVKETYASTFTEKSANPNLLDAMSLALNIMQERISRSQLVGAPPDVHIKPQLGHVALLNFNLVDLTIAEGRDAVWRKKAELERALKRTLPERPVRQVGTAPIAIPAPSPLRPLFDSLSIKNPLQGLLRRFRPQTP